MNNVDLLKGNIFKSLNSLALPIMIASLIQMAYNLTDMIWIGGLGSDAVAAIGAAGLYMWLGSGLVIIPRSGGQIKVGHSLGAGNEDNARRYALSSKQLLVFVGIVFGVLSLFLSEKMIAFFNLNNLNTFKDAVLYLRICGGFIIFSFFGNYYTGLLSSMGNSRISLYVTGIGLGLNILLDPILINGFLFIPSFGVMGAALATVISQIVVYISFQFFICNNPILKNLSIINKVDFKIIKEIVTIGLPVALESMVFAFISMVIARIVAAFGDDGVAVQKVGSQIESISWMIGDGYAVAMNSFIAQNYGAHDFKRIMKGTRIGFTVMTIWGIFTSLLLLFFAKEIFAIFIHEENVLLMGVDYLQILSVSQLFMCIEIISASCFNGLGKTIPPFIVSFVFTLLRIPLALYLSDIYGINGIWMAITISSLLKGVILLVLMIYHYRRNIIINM